LRSQETHTHTNTHKHTHTLLYGTLQPKTQKLKQAQYVKRNQCEAERPSQHARARERGGVWGRQQEAEDERRLLARKQLNPRLAHDERVH
jgi:hypothetical protein